MKFKILESVTSLGGKIYDYVKEAFKEKWKPQSKAIDNEVKLIIRRHLYNSDTVASIIFGSLRLDFGLTDEMARQVTYDLIEKVSSSARITYNERAKTVFTLDLDISPPSIDQLLQIRNATYVSINSKGERSDVPWLRWLLTEGTKVVVEGYDVSYGDYRRLGYSRTNQAIMMKTDGMVHKNFKNPEGFRVDPQFAGTSSDNFITRALLEANEEIVNLISRRIFRS